MSMEWKRRVLRGLSITGGIPCAALGGWWGLWIWCSALAVLAVFLDTVASELFEELGQ